MPHQEKSDSGRYNQLTVLLPITGMIFSKKPVPMESPEENSMDFHLDMINKIDKLLAEHYLDAPSPETFHAPPIIPAPPPVPIEPRPPLNKTLSHREIAWEPMIEPPRTIAQTIPEEFKTELSVTPAFRFITNKEFTDMILHNRRSSEEHIEIIDLNMLTVDNTTIQKTMSLTDIKNQNDETHTSSSKNGVLDEERHHKKIEIIDVQTLKQKIHEDFFITSMNKTEQKEKPHIYYFSKKNDNNKKQKNIEIEQSYAPVNFEDRLKKLKEQQIKEEELRKQQEQTMYEQLERERENLEERFKKLKEQQIKEEELRKQQEQAMYEQLAREREKLKEQQIKEELRKQQEQEMYKKIERERAKLEKLEIKKAIFEQNKQELKEKKIFKKDPGLAGATRDLKKQAKEQKQLQRLKIRQARIEMLRRNKEQKQPHKIKLKQQRLNKKEDKKQQKQIQQKTDEVGLINKEEYTDSLELDEDIKKILLLTDTLLGELPEDVLNRFLQSEDFELYEKVLNKYKVK